MLARAVAHHQGADLIGDPDPSGAGSEDDHALVARPRRGDAQTRQDRGHGDRAGAMTATASRPPTGEHTVLATYQCDEGTRQLVGQHINGRVALSDVPTGDQGKVYLVERHVPSTAELDGLVADYLAVAAHLERPPLRSDWILDG